MICLHILVEGRSEEIFVKKVLSPYLYAIKENIFTDAWCVTTKNDKKIGKKYKGGLSNYQKIHNEINTMLKQFPSAEHRF